MTEEISNLTSKNFDEKVKKGEWIVDFWASWCGPCRIMAPHFEAAAKELKGKVNFAKVDVEAEQEISERFQIFSIPTTIFFRNGEQVNRASGAMPKDVILEFIEESK